MKRRKFMKLAGLGAGGAMLTIPLYGNPVSAFGALSPIPSGDKKALADVALQAARSAGASYADVRIGRYLNQRIFTRENKVQNIVNTESFGVGVRVIAKGTWGFSATDNVTTEGIAQAAKQAAAIAKANATIRAIPSASTTSPSATTGSRSWAGS